MNKESIFFLLIKSFRFFLKILPEFLAILFFCSTFALAIFKQTRFIIAGFIGPWCNGNTTVFGAVIQGSSPCGPTKHSFGNVFFALNLSFLTFILHLV